MEIVRFDFKRIGEWLQKFHERVKAICESAESREKVAENF